MTSAEFDLAEVDKDVKAELKTGGRACECTGCGAFFGGLSGFDRHQISGEDDVYCRTADEMRAIGMVQNKHGVWLYGQSKQQLEQTEAA
jgi:hypothetical protein